MTSKNDFDIPQLMIPEVAAKEIFQQISYSFIMIPYLTLNSKLSTNSIDNTKLAFSREIFIIIGVLTALLMPYIFLISKDSQKSLELLLNTILIILLSKYKLT